MTQQEFLTQLRQLYNELPDATPEEAQHKLLIGEMIENMESKEIGNQTFDEIEDIKETIKMLLIRYEDKHPTLVATLRSISNTLQGMGI